MRKFFIVLMTTTIILSISSAILVGNTNQYKGGSLYLIILLMIPATLSLIAVLIKKDRGIVQKTVALLSAFFFYIFLFGSMFVSYTTEDNIYVFASAWGEKTVYRIAKDKEWRNPFREKIVLLPVKISYGDDKVRLIATIYYLDLQRAICLGGALESRYIQPALEAGITAVYSGAYHKPNLEFPWGTPYPPTLEIYLVRLAGMIGQEIKERANENLNPETKDAFLISSIVVQRFF